MAAPGLPITPLATFRTFDQALDATPENPHTLTHLADGAFGWHENMSAHHFAGPAAEYCAVLLAGPVRRRLFCVVIGRERFADAVRGTIHGGNTMPADFVGFKNDAPVEQRLKGLHAAPDLFVPEFEVAAPLGLPVRVKKK